MLSTKWTPKLIIWSFTFEECDFNSDYWLNFVENTSIQLKIALILLFTFIGCMSIYCNSIHHSTSSWTTPQDGGQVNVTIGIHLSTLIAECRPWWPTEWILLYSIRSLIHHQHFVRTHPIAISLFWSFEMKAIIFIRLYCDPVPPSERMSIDCETIQ